MAVCRALIYNSTESQDIDSPGNSYRGARVPFKSLLKELVLSVEGATGAIFLASDGEPVQWYSDRDAERLQLRGAYITVVVKGCRAAIEPLTVGIVGQMVIGYEGANFIVEELDKGYFLALELDLSANIGQAIYRLQPAVRRLRREIAA
jgi:predicted regulator of Ras-like GTPase activity (Roadblock/LC7/MglB family)